MNILIIIGSFYPATYYGGPVFSTLYTGRELARLGHNVYVASTNANGPENLDVETDRFISLGENLHVKYYGGATPAGFSWRLLLNIWKDIKKADVVFLQSVFSSHVPVSLFYAALLGKPVVLSPRGSLSAWTIAKSRAGLKRLWLRTLITPFSAKKLAWHATSDEERAAILRNFARANVYIAPNGIDFSEYEKPETLSSGEYMAKFAGVKSNAGLKIVSMGRLHQKKGFDILVRAFSAIRKDFPGSVLLIAGPDGGERANLERLINECGLENFVFLTGEISGADKVAFLANADLFVLPSHDENFGNVYLESLAAGTPIIASTNTPWAGVEANGCGLCVPNTVEGTAGAMRRLLEQDLDEMGRAGRAWARETFSWTAIANKLTGIFERVAAGAANG
ncbi:MAG: glycosyltransferase [Actinomycetota bacterium]|nr:glycosyltransferase [Actinomycetota bacterium]